MHTIVILLLGYILLIISSLVKFVFFINIKSRKEKKISTFYKSFRTWYLNHNFHDADENSSRMLFMKSSNIINIFWWPGLIISLLTTLNQLFDLF